MWPAKDISRASEIDSYIPPLFDSGTIDVEKLIFDVKVKERIEFIKIKQNRVFINNIDSFTMSNVYKNLRYLDVERTETPEQIVSEGAPIGEDRLLSDSDKTAKTGSHQATPAWDSQGLTGEDMDEEIPLLGPPVRDDLIKDFWHEEDLIYGEFNAGSLTIEEYTMFLDLPDEEARKKFIVELNKKRAADRLALDPQRCQGGDNNFTFVATVKKEWKEVDKVKVISVKHSMHRVFKEILKCQAIIFDITEDPKEIKKADKVLRGIIELLQFMKFEHPQQFKSIRIPRKFILISPYTTWGKTKPKKTRPYPYHVPSEFDEQGEADEEEGEHRSSKRKYPTPYMEDEYPHRVPLPEFQDHYDFENRVLEAGNMFPSVLRTYVVNSGVTYGYEEGDLEFLFKFAWSHEKLPYFGSGKNIVPVIHVDNLAKILYHIMVVGIDMRYIIAAEPFPYSMKEITLAISQILGNGTIQRYPLSSTVRAGFPKKGKIHQYLKLTSNVCLVPENLIKRSVDWNYRNQLAEFAFLSTVAAEFLTSRNLLPLRILITGPIGVGKTLIATHIAAFYDLEYLSPLVLVDKFVACLNEEIKNLMIELEMQVYLLKGKAYQRELQQRLLDEVNKAIEHRSERLDHLGSMKVDISDGQTLISDKSASQKYYEGALGDLTESEEVDKQKLIEEGIKGGNFFKDTDNAVSAPKDPQSAPDPPPPTGSTAQSRHFSIDDKLLSLFQVAQHLVPEMNLEADIKVIRIKLLQSKINETQNMIDMNGGLPTEALLSDLVYWYLSKPTVKKRGFVLDDFPDTYELAKAMFYQADKEDILAMNPQPQGEFGAKNELQKDFLPNVIFDLTSGLENVCKEILSLPFYKQWDFTKVEDKLLERIEMHKQLMKVKPSVMTFFELHGLLPTIFIVNHSSPLWLSDILLSMCMALGDPRRYNGHEQIKGLLEGIEYVRDQKRRLENLVNKVVKGKCASLRHSHQEKWAELVALTKIENEKSENVSRMTAREYIIRYILPTLNDSLIEAVKQKGVKDEIPIQMITEQILGRNTQMSKPFCFPYISTEFMEDLDASITSLNDLEEELESDSEDEYIRLHSTSERTKMQRTAHGHGQKTFKCPDPNTTSDKFTQTAMTN